jgi:hypothetical protein
MAFDKTPNVWLANWSQDGVDVTVPIATFPQLTAAEADEVTGDIRKIWWSILDELYNQYNDLSSANQPGKWTSTKSVSVNASTGVITNTYTNTIQTEIGTQEVADES